jgi:cytochrome c
MKTTALALACLSASALFTPAAASAADADAAAQMLRHNACFRCHAADKEKNGPTWPQISARYHSRPNAEQRLIHYLSTPGQTAQFADGREAYHKVLPTSDAEALNNVAQWILSF